MVLLEDWERRPPVVVYGNPMSHTCCGIGLGGSSSYFKISSVLGTKNRAHIAGVLTVLGILTFCIQIAGFQFEIDVAKLLVNNIRNVDIDLGVVYRIKMDLIAEDYSFSKGS